MDIMEEEAARVIDVCQKLYQAVMSLPEATQGIIPANWKSDAERYRRRKGIYFRILHNILLRMIHSITGNESITWYKVMFCQNLSVFWGTRNLQPVARWGFCFMVGPVPSIEWIIWKFDYYFCIWKIVSNLTYRRIDYIHLRAILAFPESSGHIIIMLILIISVKTLVIAVFKSL